MPSSLSSVPPGFSALEPKQRLNALLDHPNAQALVRAQPAEDLYVAIAEVGLADATEVVQLASPDQFRTFVDLGGWKRDKIDPHAVLTWLRAARGDERGGFLRKWDGLDVEVVQTMLRSFTVIHDLEEDPDVFPEGPTLETPERRYLIELTVEGVEEAALRRLLGDLTARNPFEFTRMIEALRWELSTELEEHAFRFRTGRLEDLGFPPPERAARLFSYLPAPAAKPTTGTALMPLAEDTHWLELASADLTADERAHWQEELRYMVNAVLVAEAADPGDLHAVRLASEMARDYLALGLERLSAGDPSLAGKTLQETSSERLFQAGFSATLDVRYKADALVREAGKGLTLLPFERRIVAALRRKRPLRALKVEGAEPVPFRSRAELRQVEQLLHRARFQSAWLARLGISPPRDESEEAAQDVERALLTAVSRAALGHALEPKPLSLEELTQLGPALFQGDSSTPHTKAECQRAVIQCLVQQAGSSDEAAEAERVGMAAIERLRQELGSVLLSGRPPRPVASTLLFLQEKL